MVPILLHLLLEGHPLKHILLVEDDASVLRALRTLLEEAGHAVDSADSFPAAAELLRRESFDCLITDLDLPGGGTGFDLVRRARAYRPELPSILVTGYGCTEVRRQARELPLAGYLEKPFDPEALLSLLSAP
jgi:CheY-like chemotaxis protein